MYRAIKEKFTGINQAKVARITGLAHPTVNRIINNKIICRKSTAYCLTKAVNKDAEINEYFTKVEE